MKISSLEKLEKKKGMGKTPIPYRLQNRRFHTRRIFFKFTQSNAIIGKESNAIIGKESNAIIGKESNAIIKKGGFLCKMHYFF